jgi:hypothetical protein
MLSSILLCLLFNMASAIEIDLREHTLGQYFWCRLYRSVLCMQLALLTRISGSETKQLQVHVSLLL